MLQLLKTHRTLWFLLSMALVGVAACEPLAPPPENQAIIVITNTPTEVILPSPTPLLGTPIPTRIPPTATPTLTATPNIEEAFACDNPEGLVFDTTFYSDITGDEIEYRVYLPPCFYESAKRFPYVILFHGSSYNHTQWTVGAEIDQVLEEALLDGAEDIAPMVLIMPNGGQSQELNNFEPGESWEDIVIGELIPAVESAFCVWNSSEGRAIGGISRGGFWAASIALRNPGLFTSFGGHSPSFYEDNAPSANNPLDLARAASPTIPLRIYLDIARADSGAENVGQFSTSLFSRSVDHTYNVSPSGGHNNEYWSSQARSYLEFYSEPWPKDIAALPTCF